MRRSLDRREALKGLLPASLTLCGALVQVSPTSASLPTADAPGGSTRRWLKLVSDLSGRPTFAVTRGDVWGFKPQADDLTTDAFAKRLYGYWSLVARQARPRPDGSIDLTTKAWTFYLDPQTGTVTAILPNPYTGQTVSCQPLSGPARAQTFPNGGGDAPVLDLRERRLGDHVWLDVSRVSRFRPADTSWFKLEADMTVHACRAVDVDNVGASLTPNTWSHTLTAEWQTWMKMHGTPGHILFRGDGAFIAHLDETPGALRTAIEACFPGEMAAVTLWEKEL